MGADDQLRRTLPTAPMQGIANNLSITTIGGVVPRGEEILHSTPMGEAHLVEAKEKPENIANVKPGQTATIKLSAYDHTIFGALQAEVIFVSADLFKEKRARKEEIPYRVTLSVDRSQLTERQPRLEIRPGLQATADLFTGTKTVLHGSHQAALHIARGARERARTPADLGLRRAPSRSAQGFKTNRPPSQNAKKCTDVEPSPKSRTQMARP